MNVEKRLKELNIVLPDPPPKGGKYKTIKEVNGLLYISGHGCTKNGEPVFKGKVGGKYTVEDGQEAAKLCVLNAIASVKNYLGNLDRVKTIVKMLAFVASAPEFNEQPKVIDGASQLLEDIWGEDGISARSAIGTNELPGDITVEIEFIIEIY